MAGIAGLTLEQTAGFLLGVASIGSAAAALYFGRSDAPALAERVGSIATATAARGKKASATDQNRRRVVQDTLRELAARDRGAGRRNARPTLVGRLRQAGMNWTRSTYFAAVAGSAMLVYLIALSAFGLGVGPSLVAGFTAGLVIPHFYIGYRRSRRLRAFTAEFPNALDVIVRGVQAGLSLTECLNIVATEAQEPVRREFGAILHDQTLGVPLDEAVERLAVRVPLSEANFFAIVIAIQSRSGGNLAEALGNLTKVLRDRKAMFSKIKALSAEAKASAMIIGCMPVVVGGLLEFTSPDYVGLLFSTTTGNIALAGSAVWMTIGSLVMRKMINFDF